MIRLSGQRGVPVTAFDRRRLTMLLDQDKARKPTLGVSIADAARIAEERGSRPTSGAYVGRVKSGSPAQKAGLRRDDVITELGGRPIHTAADVHAVMASHHPGDRLGLTFDRDGREMRVMVKI
jgi:S1-C subfamily serine protease